MTILLNSSVKLMSTEWSIFLFLLTDTAIFACPSMKFASWRFLADFLYLQPQINSSLEKFPQQDEQRMNAHTLKNSGTLCLCEDREDKHHLRLC